MIATRLSDLKVIQSRERTTGVLHGQTQTQTESRQQEAPGTLEGPSQDQLAGSGWGPIHGGFAVAAMMGPGGDTTIKAGVVWLS